MVVVKYINRKDISYIEKQIAKMAGINPNLLVTTLNVNGLHTSKTEICRTEFKKLYNYIFSKETYFIFKNINWL